MTCISLPLTPESIPQWDIKLSTGVMFFFSNGPHRTNGRYTLLELIALTLKFSDLTDTTNALTSLNPNKLTNAANSFS